MDSLKCIFTRRSIRKYTTKDIDLDSLKTIIEAGMYAPSARNQQAWHFLLIKNKTLLKKLSEIHPHGKMLENANAAILVCYDTNIEFSKGYGAVDCSAATQNILLAAHSMGIGSVWLGVYPRQERMKDISLMFNLPENINPFSLISIGYSAEIISQPERFKEDRIHYENW